MACSNPPALSEVIGWARQAGALLQAGLGKKHTIEYKGPVNLVTEMDQASEALLIDLIRSRCPDHKIITEESGALAGADGCCWYIDPLDGTTNYAHGLPIYAVSIGFVANGIQQLGVVYDPSRDECFSAEHGRGAWLNDQPIHVTTETELQHSLLVTGFPYSILTSNNNNLGYFNRFSLRSRAVRRLGSAALDLCYVAMGRFDGYWELLLQSWDIAAGSLIAAEAGAHLTDMQGGPNFMSPPHSLIVANPAIHAQMLAVIQETPLEVF
ncbi:MAG TPA: inositol monophosphatase family protein [Anaerolineaceae bacterium]|nr:inositol monophosphatase family protein [Anaerolineaceae bacterium]HOD04618.1 inositol monophosphatase family protein [Anaerolineaceae bacterium]HOG79912.1 inositol monophosphatase family protein [Anaerolineaceae bacterium]